MSNLNLDGKMLFEMSILNGKGAIYKVVDSVISLYKEDIQWPYRIEAEDRTIIVSEDGSIETEYNTKEKE